MPIWLTHANPPPTHFAIPVERELTQSTRSATPGVVSSLFLELTACTRRRYRSVEITFLNYCHCQIHQLPRLYIILLCVDRSTLYMIILCAWVCVRDIRLDESIFFHHRQPSVLHHADNPFGSTINIVSSVTMQQNHPPPVHHRSDRLSSSGLLKWQSRLTLSLSIYLTLSLTPSVTPSLTWAYTRARTALSVFTAIVLEVYYYYHTSTAGWNTINRISHLFYSPDDANDDDNNNTV